MSYNSAVKHSMADGHLTIIGHGRVAVLNAQIKCLIEYIRINPNADKNHKLAVLAIANDGGEITPAIAIGLIHDAVFGESIERGTIDSDKIISWLEKHGWTISILSVTAKANTPQEYTSFIDDLFKCTTSPGEVYCLYGFENGGAAALVAMSKKLTELGKYNIISGLGYDTVPGTLSDGAGDHSDHFSTCVRVHTLGAEFTQSTTTLQ